MSVDTDQSMLELTETMLVPYEDTADGQEHHTHILDPQRNMHIWRPGMAMKEVLFIARMQGLPVTALCGYTWVSKRNPDKYPACEECVRIAGELMRAEGE